MPTPPPTPPRLIRVPLLALSAVILVLFGWSLYASTIGAPSLVWAAAGFSLIGLASAVFAALLGLGRFNNGFGLAALCVAGATTTCAVLGWLDLRANLTAVPELDRVLRPWLVASAATGLGVAGLAALAVLLRSSRSWVYAASGAAALAVVVIGAALLRGPAAGLLPDAEGDPDPLRVGLLLFMAVTALALLSAGGHLVIRAFEVGRENARTPAPVAESPAA